MIFLRAAFGLWMQQSHTNENINKETESEKYGFQSYFCSIKRNILAVWQYAYRRSRQLK